MTAVIYLRLRMTSQIYGWSKTGYFGALTIDLLLLGHYLNILTILTNPYTNLCRGSVAFEKKPPKTAYGIFSIRGPLWITR